MRTIFLSPSFLMCTFFCKGTLGPRPKRTALWSSPKQKNTKDVGIYFCPFLLFFSPSPSTLSLRNCFLNYIYCKCLINKIYCLQGRVPILHLVDTGSMAQAFLLCFSPLNFPFLLLPFLVPLHTFFFLAFLSRA